MDNIDTGIKQYGAVTIAQTVLYIYHKYNCPIIRIKEQDFSLIYDIPAPDEDNMFYREYMIYLSKSRKQDIYDCCAYVQTWLILLGWQPTIYNNTGMDDILIGNNIKYNWGNSLAEDIKNIKTMHRRAYKKAYRQNAKVKENLAIAGSTAL